MEGKIELTVDERQVLTSLLSRGFKWIARDSDMSLWVYGKEPTLGEYSKKWMPISHFVEVAEPMEGSEHNLDWFTWLTVIEHANIEKVLNHGLKNSSSTTTLQNPRGRIQLHEEICVKLHEIYVAKNADYGNSFVTVRNEVDRAIIVRLMDKMERLKTLTRKGYDAKVEESVEDTLMDMANYAIMEILEMRLTKEKEGDNI